MDVLCVYVCLYLWNGMDIEMLMIHISQGERKGKKIDIITYPGSARTWRAVLRKIHV